MRRWPVMAGLLAVVAAFSAGCQTGTGNQPAEKNTEVVQASEAADQSPTEVFDAFMSASDAGDCENAATMLADDNFKSMYESSCRAGAYSETATPDQYQVVGEAEHGDTATLTISGGGDPEPVILLRQDGRWLISMSETAQAATSSSPTP